MNKNSMMKNKRNRQLGVGMIEVLVTIVITAIGLLGVAKMQTIAMQSSYDASQRSLAVYLANDVISRMRSTTDGICSDTNYVTETDCVDVYGNTWTVVNYLASYDTTSMTNDDVGGASQSTPGQSCIGAGNSCTEAQKITHDLWEWEQVIDGGLFNANGCISVVQNSVRVIVAWDAIDLATTASQPGNTNDDPHPDLTCGTVDADLSRRQVKIIAVI